jgi:hypothetical protein
MYTPTLVCLLADDLREKGRSRFFNTYPVRRTILFSFLYFGSSSLLLFPSLLFFLPSFLLLFYFIVISSSVPLT